MYLVEYPDRSAHLYDSAPVQSALSSQRYENRQDKNWYGEKNLEGLNAIGHFDCGMKCE